MEELELRAAAGYVEPAVQSEFPGLRLDWFSMDARDAPSPTPIVGRLELMSNRFRGASVVAMRTHPIPRAYRSFFRQIGLDPDTTRIPSEEAALTRLMQGGFRSNGLVRDATTIALVETGVPIWALDAEVVGEGGLGIRTSEEGDRLGTGEYADYLQPGRLVVADSRCVHALLFGEVAAGHAPTRKTRRLVLFSVAVEGVPTIHVEEAMWLCAEILASR